jgi:acetyl esterase/lipase
MPVWTDIVYARRPQRELRVDIHVPDGVKNPPLVLNIPMRGLFKCERSSASTWIVEEGFALAAIECRVSGEAIAPAAVHDCKAAIRWLRANAAKYGYDGDRIGVWGFSAGGLLASLMATSTAVAELEGDGDHLDVSSAVQAAVDQCGAPHDMTYFARPDVAATYDKVAENLRRWLGGPVAERPELARLVSPATYVTPQCPPVLLIHGDQDDITPLAETQLFYDQLKLAGVDATLKVLAGIGHSRVEELIRPDLVAFLRRVLVGGDRD